MCLLAHVTHFTTAGASVEKIAVASKTQRPSTARFARAHRLPYCYSATVNRIAKLCPLNNLGFYVCGHYSNTGCGVFKRGGTKLERFLHKNHNTQQKLLNFMNWVNGEVSKSPKI